MGNLQEASDLQNLVSVSARRFQESPFIERTDGPNFVRGVYAGRYFPIYAGEDEIEKYWCLRQKAAIFDTPEKPIEIKGPDAERFLNHVLSRDVTKMTPGRGYYAIACTPQGGVFMDGVMFRFDQDTFWYVQADGPFEAWLLAHSGGFDVTISDPDVRVLQIQGPASMDIMRAATDGEIDEKLKYFRAGFYDIAGQNLYVSRTGFTNELGYEIYAGPDTDHIALWDHLMSCGRLFGMEFSSCRAMTLRRIEGGILGNITDMDASMTPFEAGLAPLIDMNKPDFVGRKALENQDRRSCLFGVTSADATPAAGSKILDKEVVVGRVTAGVPSPTLSLGIGYVVFTKPGDWVGQNLRMRLPDGAEHVVDVVDLPFFDREKKLVRGLDRTIPTRPT
ncbi:MAG: aminomethyltransferase family protein [Pseudomonadota bacterium]